MTNHPLAEVFGFPTDNFSEDAARYRRHKLCPFHNKVPNCTKDKASDPLGVCSVFDEGEAVITCPVRFREAWLIAEDAADFFFPRGAKWTSLTEVPLNDRLGKSAGAVDIVLVAYDGRGTAVDFGALEVQAVYISGNIRRPFEYYMQATKKRANMDWRGRPNYPRPDYLSSSRKRLAPQLLFKGGILAAWNKKIAVALGRRFFETFPPLEEVQPSEADIAWLIYQLQHNARKNRYVLTPYRTVYTRFSVALDQITKPEPGEFQHFLSELLQRLDEQLQDGNPPDVRTIDLEF